MVRNKYSDTNTDNNKYKTMPAVSMNLLSLIGNKYSNTNSCHLATGNNRHKTMPAINMNKYSDTNTHATPVITSTKLCLPTAYFP